MKEIILASASPRRSELMVQVGYNFKIMPSDIDEIIDYNLEPAKAVENIALSKAINIAEKLNNNSIVIGADTVVVTQNKILGKPDDIKQAFEMLTLLQGNWHEVITGIAVVDALDFKQKSGYQITRVKMRSLTKHEINSYISTGEHFDKAGSYGIQGKGALLVEKIEGCYFNVVGLPLAQLSGLLSEFGISLL